MAGPSHIPLRRPVASPIYVAGHRNNIKRLWGEIEAPLLLVLGVISITLGTIGFQRHFIETGEPYTLGRCLYASMELLEFIGGNIPSPIPWELEVARWLSPAVTMYAVLLGLATIFRNQIQGLRLRLSSRHVVICGLGQKGLLLAKNFQAAGRRVVVVDADGNNPNIAVCRELGIVVFLGDARDEYILLKAGVTRADSLIAVCEEDATNAEIAIRTSRLLTHRRNRKLNCAIHIKDPQLWAFLRQQELASEPGTSYRLDFFNIYDHGARLLLREYPILSKTAGAKDKAPHLLVVGIGNLGSQVILHAAREWYLCRKDATAKLRISVIDLEAERRIGTLCQDNPLVRRVCGFEAYPIDTRSAQYHQGQFLFKKGEQCDISMIYICIEDESTGLSAALSLQQQLRSQDVQILVRMREDAGLASLLQGTRGNLANIRNLHVFGLLEHTCKPELLNDGSHEALARAIHEEYVRREARMGNTPETNPSMVAWDKLGDELIEANRDQADEIGVKLSAIGCDILPWTDYGADQFSFRPDEVELMAKIEHERWCQQKRAQGWKYGPVRSDQKKMHPSLLEWNDLRFSEEEKDKDRNTVRQIPRFLALAGFEIYRISSPIAKQI